MVDLSEIRAMALALPEVEEGPPVPAARRVAGFKVRGKSFLGVETGGLTMTLSLPEAETRALVAKHPQTYEGIWRNRETLVGVRADLAKLTTATVKSLIERSWRHTSSENAKTK
jgi:hypothetical protein